MNRERLARKHLDKIYRHMKAAIDREDYNRLRQLHLSFERTIVILQTEVASKKSFAQTQEVEKKGLKSKNRPCIIRVTTTKGDEANEQGFGSQGFQA